MQVSHGERFEKGDSAISMLSYFARRLRDPEDETKWRRRMPKDDNRIRAELHDFCKLECGRYRRGHKSSCEGDTILEQYSEATSRMLTLARSDLAWFSTTGGGASCALIAFLTREIV